MKKNDAEVSLGILPKYFEQLEKDNAVLNQNNGQMIDIDTLPEEMPASDVKVMKKSNECGYCVGAHIARMLDLKSVFSERLGIQIHDSGAVYEANLQNLPVARFTYDHATHELFGRLLKCDHFSEWFEELDCPYENKDAILQLVNEDYLDNIDWLQCEWKTWTDILQDYLEEYCDAPCRCFGPSQWPRKAKPSKVFAKMCKLNGIEIQ